MSLGDNVIAVKILTKLVTPFEETQAFKLGLIDKNGKVLKDPVTSEENSAYDLLDKLVFNLKRLIFKLPGGKSKLSSLVAAYWLVKENKDISEFEHIESLIESGVTLVEEEHEVLQFLEDMAANNTSGPVETNNPNAVRKKKPKVLVRPKDLKVD